MSEEVKEMLAEVEKNDIQPEEPKIELSPEEQKDNEYIDAIMEDESEVVDIEW